MNQPAAVVLSPEAPYPLQGGGAMRTASLLHYLAAHFSLDLILFRQAGDSDPALSLPPDLARNVSTITLPFHSRAPLAWGLRNANRWVKGAPPLLDRFGGQRRQIARILEGRKYALGLIEHFWCAPYVEQLSAVCARTVLDLHNVESALHASCAEAGRWPLSLAHRRFAQAYLREERRWLPRFSSILAASEADAGRVRGRGLSTPVDVYPNALPFSPVPLVEEDNAIGFSANFEYQPNIAAVRFLVREIWPRLHQRFPELKLRLIGKNPHAVSKLTRGVPNLEITGPVAEAIPEIAKLKIAIVPLLSGSGTRIKILEAWAAARPTVSTSIGAEGLDRGPGRELVIADGAERFIEAVAQLLGSLERRRRIGCAARLRYEEEFTWEKAWQRLKLV